MLLRVNVSPTALAFTDRFHLVFHQHFTVLQKTTKIKRKRKKKKKAPFIKYSTVTKFCKTSKWENRHNTQLDILPTKSSLRDEPHYLSTHKSENQANHTTNRQPMTAALNCLSTNQGFLFLKNKEKEKKVHSAAAQLPMRWLRSSTPSCEVVQHLGFLYPSCNSNADYCTCITRVPINLFLGLPVQSLDGKICKCDSNDQSRSHCHFSSTEAQPPAQALGHSRPDAALKSQPFQGFVAGQSHLIHVYLLYNDRSGKVSTKS